MSKGLNKGNVICFGKNSWYVIDVDSEKNEALLLSCSPVDKMCFHENLTLDKDTENHGCYWHNSTIRKWLNEDYYQTVFTQDEKNIIVESETTNPQYENKQRNLILPSEETTYDKVFLLNIHEATRYLPGKTFTSCHEHWWLRNPTINRDKAVFVLQDGEYYCYGSKADHKDIGIRPAIRIKTNSDYFLNHVKVRSGESMPQHNLVIYPISSILNNKDNLSDHTVIIMAKGPTEPDIIDEYAARLLNSDCNSYVFTGEYSVCWKRRFSNMFDRLNQSNRKSAIFISNNTSGVLEELVHSNERMILFIDSLDLIMN